jgi:hypothetical protein
VSWFTGAVGPIWSDIVRSTTLGPAVFEVLPDHQQRVRGWAVTHRLTHAAQHDVHFPFVEGWAVLDGGITAISGYGLTSLTHGVRVIGVAALRLLLADLGAEGPLPAELDLDPDELRHRVRTTPPDTPDLVEQAELLAACQDARMLGWVARTLAADADHSTPAVG